MPTPPNHPPEMEKSRALSWLCAIFQKEELSREEKQDVIRSLAKDYKMKKKEKHV